MRIHNVILALAATAFFGCAHTTMRGGVAMKLSDREAHVCMGDQEVSVGDKVTAFRNRCTGGRGKSGDSDRSCEKIKIGVGTVTKLLNEHYSVVQFDSGVQFDEGTFVEKL